MKRPSAVKQANAQPTHTISRIYTEKKNSRRIAKLISGQFESFTIHPTVGYYRGNREPSIAIEIVAANPAAIRKLAERIKEMNGQKSILTVSFSAQVDSIRW
jgi:hypothetical protein